jgi:hypothetical protein
MKIAASRAEAIALGLPRYQGRPCKLGHTVRSTWNFNCVKCKEAARRARYASNLEYRERCRARARQWYRDRHPRP